MTVKLKDEKLEFRTTRMLRRCRKASAVFVVPKKWTDKMSVILEVAKDSGIIGRLMFLQDRMNRFSKRIHSDVRASMDQGRRAKPWDVEGVETADWYPQRTFKRREYILS